MGLESVSSMNTTHRINNSSRRKRMKQWWTQREFWTQWNLNENDKVNSKIGDKAFVPSKSRDFYGLLISCKATASRGFTKLKSKFSIDNVEIKKAFSLIRTCICETYLQCFQFKILNDVLFKNSRLAKIGLIQSDHCTLCNIGVETMDHLFFYCFYSRVFWEEFESYWFAIAKEQRKLELKTILLGVTDTKCPLFNYLIVLGKLYLWNCRRNKSLPFFSSYKELIWKYENMKLNAKSLPRTITVTCLRLSGNLFGIIIR